MEFFGNDLLLYLDSAKAIYKEVKDLPIIDYHCHLDQNKIKEDVTFSNIGELWLSGDHYKWRAMRLCGVDEEYITGKKSYHDKFVKYAEILPNLAGNPLYYWTHLELKQIFGIDEPLNGESAERIYKQANEKLKDISVSMLLSQYKVEYVATTDDPCDDLSAHGKYKNTIVAPTFRPDKLLDFGGAYLQKLSKTVGYEIKTLADLLRAQDFGRSSARSGSEIAVFCIARLQDLRSRFSALSYNAVCFCGGGGKYISKTQRTCQGIPRSSVRVRSRRACQTL